MLNPLPLNRITLLLIIVVILLIAGGFFIYQKIFFSSKVQQEVEEIDLIFDPEGPYALLVPRRDGKALTLNIKRTASYDQIKYELAYNSEGVDRGASGEINIKEKKGEYEQEILFGSCSTGGKCVYDKGVENGTLTLHIKKGSRAFRMITQWHLQQPDVALGILTSGDNHFTYKVDSEKSGSSTNDLYLVKFTIINDLSGAPKLPSDKSIIGKVYALNTPLAKILPNGILTIELAENPLAESKIARFDIKANNWVEYKTNIEGSKLTAQVDEAGVFTVLTPKK